LYASQTKNPPFGGFILLAEREGLAALIPYACGGGLEK
jgi:hypothetical protein